MLAQASVEALRTRFDASGLSGTETVYASVNGENDIAFVAIGTDGSITTYKDDSYPEALLEQEIMALCCSKYDDDKIHIAASADDKYTEERSGRGPCVLIELIAAAVTVALCAVFLLIYWTLFKDTEKTLIIGGIICAPVALFVCAGIKARRKDGGK